MLGPGIQECRVLAKGHRCFGFPVLGLFLDPEGPFGLKGIIPSH